MTAARAARAADLEERREGGGTRLVRGQRVRLRCAAIDAAVSISSYNDESSEEMAELDADIDGHYYAAWSSLVKANAAPCALPTVAL